MVIVNKCVLEVMWSRINGHLVTQVMITQVKVVKNSAFSGATMTAKYD